jgi:hypothetical protein
MPEPIPGVPVVAMAFDSMEIQFAESIEVRQVWVVTFAADEIAAAAAVLSTVPPLYRTLPLASVSISGREGVHCWKFDVSYSSTRSKPISSVQANVEDPEISYQLSGETKHVTQSLSTRGKTAAGLLINGGSGTVTDSGAIGVQKDSVAGADILIPVVTFSETHYFLRKDMTRTLRTKWENLFAHTNDAPFRGYAADEVLFEGLQTTIKGSPDGVVPVTFQFRRRAHVTGEDIGGIVLDVNGWELVDMRYKDEKNTTTNRTEKTPSKVLLHTVYKSASFADLGISTT